MREANVRGGDDPRFRSDILVEPTTNCTGSDEEVAFAAWAIPPAGPDAWNWAEDVKQRHGKDATPEGLKKVIGACMRLRHNSPFEHGLMSVYCEMPGVVWWQLTRQRFMSMDSEDFSFNLESGRYKVLEPEFYVPPKGRPVAEPEKFNPMRPDLLDDESAYSYLSDAMWGQLAGCWDTYQRLIRRGVAREVARLVLPNWALYCDGYVTAKPLTWLQFFGKRNRTTDTAVPTFPQWEIEQFCRQAEAAFAAHWPLTYEAFVAAGRVAP